MRQRSGAITVTTLRIFMMSVFRLYGSYVDRMLDRMSLFDVTAQPS